MGEVVVVNRTPARAQELAASVTDGVVSTANLDELAAHVDQASLVFVAATVSEPIIERHHVENRATPVVLIDLALPHGVARDVATNPVVQRLDIETLKNRIDHALEERRDAVSAAHDIVRSDVEKFLDDQRARGAAALVTQLREHFDDVVSTEFDRRANELSSLNDEQSELVKSIVRSVVAKIAHRPTTVLKESAGTDQGTRLSDATRTMFDLS